MVIFLRVEVEFEENLLFSREKKVVFYAGVSSGKQISEIYLGGVTKYFLSVELEEQGLECGLYRH